LNPEIKGEYTMHTGRNMNRAIALTALLAAGAAALAADAAKKVPGEKWKQTVSIEAGGMKMPGRSFEVCVPKGKVEEALAKPPQNPNQNCTMSDIKRDGNRYSATMRCTGTPPVEGKVELTHEGNRTVGQLEMTMQGMTMTTKFDATNTGAACEATDYGD
jgi:hypothetical protein